jgi:hypothetical protein
VIHPNEARPLTDSISMLIENTLKLQECWEIEIHRMKISLRQAKEPSKQLNRVLGIALIQQEDRIRLFIEEK